MPRTRRAFSLMSRDFDPSKEHAPEYSYSGPKSVEEMNGEPNDVMGRELLAAQVARVSHEDRSGSRLL